MTFKVEYDTSDYSDVINTEMKEVTNQKASGRCWGFAALNLMRIELAKILLKKPDVDWGSFNPPNAFSPDGDGINDSFTLTNLNDTNQNLPIDACDNNFESIVFVDRTGIEVYKSYNKNFEWDDVMESK